MYNVTVVKIIIIDSKTVHTNIHTESLTGASCIRYLTTESSNWRQHTTGSIQGHLSIITSAPIKINAEFEVVPWTNTPFGWYHSPSEFR